MYNGIGLPTARGSGTNGFVQRNLAHVKKSSLSRPKVVAKPDDDFNRPPNYDIIIHKEKRKIESNCLALRRELEEENWTHEDIEEEIDAYRKRKLKLLMERMGPKQPDKAAIKPKDEENKEDLTSKQEPECRE